MKRILFVCLGNICRSPMAEFIMKDLVRKSGRESEFYIASAATSSEEEGNPVYYAAEMTLREHGISCKGKFATRLKASDYRKYDLIIGMEKSNINNILRICGGDPEGKVKRLLDFTDCSGDIADPWYTRNFALTYSQIEKGCTGLLKKI